MKKTLKLERLNADPEYLSEKIHEAFPELSAGGGGVYKLWQVRENRTELIALPVDVNNAQALLNFDELNRSCVYVKADVNTQVYRLCNVHLCLFLLHDKDLQRVDREESWLVMAQGLINVW